MGQIEVKSLVIKPNSLAAVAIEKLQAIGMEKSKRKDVFKAIRERQPFKGLSDSTIRAQVYLACIYLERVGWKKSAETHEIETKSGGDSK